MPPFPWITLLLLVAYLTGGVPFSLILVRWRTGIDLRTFGSGNIGATNARRAAGTAVGLAALTCDVLKGTLPTLAASVVAAHTIPETPQVYAALVALAAVTGHIYPVYLRFKASGKGVATALGGFLVLAPSAVAAALVVFIATVAISRRVSLGSLTACGVLPFAVWLTSRDLGLFVGAIAIATLIIIRHRENIRRLRQKTEPKI